MLGSDGMRRNRAKNTFFTTTTSIPHIIGIYIDTMYTMVDRIGGEQGARNDIDILTNEEGKRERKTLKQPYRTKR
jgi:hypothetical protein